MISKQKLLLILFCVLPAFSLAKTTENDNYFLKLKSRLLHPKKVISSSQAKKIAIDSQNIPTLNAPLFCQKGVGPCYRMARTMLYDTFEPGFTTPDKVNGGKDYMPWAAVDSPNLKWVYPDFRTRWDSEVKAKVDEFLRDGKPVIVKGRTIRGYWHASLIVGKKNGEYLVNDSSYCGKNIPIGEIYDDKKIDGVFMYDRK